MQSQNLVKNSQIERKSNDQKKFNILITGDNNYNNVRKMDIKLNQILNDIQFETHLGTLGGKYGAQLLAQIYAEQNNYKFTSFDNTWFKKTRKSSAQLYHILLDISVKWSNLVLIFSNIYTKKIEQIIKLCQKYDKPYFLIKE